MIETYKENSFLGSMHPKPGQSVFKYQDRKVQKLTDKDYEITFDITGKKKKLIIQKGCMYVIALNENNAKRKFAKMFLNQLKYAKASV